MSIVTKRLNGSKWHLALGSRLRCARWGRSSAQNTGTAPSNVYCGQMAGWIKTPLGTEIGLGPGHIVLDGDPLTRSERGTTVPHPLFAAHAYCGHGRPSQLLLSSCFRLLRQLRTVSYYVSCWVNIFSSANYTRIS